MKPGEKMSAHSKNRNPKPDSTAKATAAPRMGQQSYGYGKRSPLRRMQLAERKQYRGQTPGYSRFRGGRQMVQAWPGGAL